MLLGISEERFSGKNILSQHKSQKKNNPRNNPENIEFFFLNASN